VAQHFSELVDTRKPHPEEHAAGVRLEGWERAPRLLPILRDAALCAAPQDEEFLYLRSSMNHDLKPIELGEHRGSIDSQALRRPRSGRLEAWAAA
jgi:hypothetical protein